MAKTTIKETTEKFARDGNLIERATREEIPYNDTTNKLLEKRRKLREKISKLKHIGDDDDLTSEDDGDSLWV